RAGKRVRRLPLERLSRSEGEKLGQERYGPRAGLGHHELRPLRGGSAGVGNERQPAGDRVGRREREGDRAGPRARERENVVPGGGRRAAEQVVAYGADLAGGVDRECPLVPAE